MFDLSTEGNTHSDGTASHEWCADEAEFVKQNVIDLIHES